MGGASGSGDFERFLEPFMEKVGNESINALNVACRRRLSLFLDSEGGVVGCEGEIICNDWTGLAELAGFEKLEIDRCGREKTPTMEVLHYWGKKSDPPPTVKNLVKFLLQMDRRDVITDCADHMERDVGLYRTRQAKLEAAAREAATAKSPKNKNSQMAVSQVLNSRDETIFFDAFVIYNPESKSDFEFVLELIDKYEGPDYNMKLFIPWRDDLPGAAQNTLTAELIEKMCRRCLVVISKAFYDCSACDFQLKFAQALSPGARSKRVIPLMIEDCKLPSILNFVGPAKFYNVHLREWQWPRVAASILSELDPDPEVWDPDGENAKDILLDTSDPKHRVQWQSLAVCLSAREEHAEKLAEKQKNASK